MKEIYFTTDELCSLDDECDIKEIRKEIDDIIMTFDEWGSNYCNDDVNIIFRKERYVLVWYLSGTTDINVFESRYEMARWCFTELDMRDYYITDDEHDLIVRNYIRDLLFGSAEKYDEYCKVA